MSHGDILARHSVALSRKKTEMASISNDKNGRRRIQFYGADGKRKAIRLGKVSKRVAEAVRVKVEALVTASITSHSVDDETARWLAGLDKTMAERLSRVGLIPSREYGTLREFVAAYIDSRSDIEPETRRAWMQVLQRLVDLFGAECPLKSITREQAAMWRQSLVNEGLADATVRKYTGYAKHFYAVAVDRELLTRSPFAKLVSGSVGNDERQQFVTREETSRLIEVCPNAEFRLIVALSRYGGLRCPSEHLGLRWTDIDWESGLMTVTSPKTKKQGKPKRLVPIFDELKPFLDDCWDQADPGEFVLAKYRSGSGAYIRKRLGTLVERAGLVCWPRITHNLRSSRQTELERENPTHVVCAIMGNTPQVANRHYLQVTASDLQRAAGKAAQKAAQYPAELGRMGSQSGSTRSKAESLEPSTVPSVTTRCEGKREGGKCRPTGVDGNRTHLAPFQRPHRV